MTFANYHIDNPNNYFVQFCVLVVSFFVKILRFFKIKNLKTGAIFYTNKKLLRIYTISEGLKSIVEKFDKKKAALEYKRVYRILTTYRYMYLRLESVKFFQNSDTKDIANTTLSNFYYAENFVRQLAFADEDKNVDDNNLTEFASALSLGSL